MTNIEIIEDLKKAGNPYLKALLNIKERLQKELEVINEERDFYAKQYYLEENLTKKNFYKNLLLEQHTKISAILNAISIVYEESKEQELDLQALYEEYDEYDDIS